MRRIYYAEEMSPGEEEWSVDVYQDGTIEFSSDIGITLFPYPKIF